MARRLPLLSNSSSGSRLEASGSAREVSSGALRAALRRRPIEAIGIADTGSGEQAARFARALASALAARGERPVGTLLAFTTPPGPDLALKRALVEAREAEREQKADAHAGAREADRERDMEAARAGTRGPNAEVRGHAREQDVDAVGALSLCAIDPDADADALPDLSPPDGAIALLVGPPALAAFDPTLAILLGADRPLARWPAELRAHRERYQLALGAERPGIALALAALVRGPRILPGR